MLTYKAMYKNVDGGVHAEVLDFPGTITFGRNLGEAREMLAAALVDMAETNFAAHEALPIPATQASAIRIRIWRNRSICC